MIPTLNLDGSGVFDMQDEYDNLPWKPVEFSHTNDDGTPATLTGEWKLKFYKPEDFPTAFVEFTVGTGLTITDNVLVFEKPDDVIVPAGRYQFFLINKDDDGVFVIYRGSLTVKQIDLWESAL